MYYNYCFARRITKLINFILYDFIEIQILTL